MQLGAAAQQRAAALWRRGGLGDPGAAPLVGEDWSPTMVVKDELADLMVDLMVVNDELVSDELVDDWLILWLI